MKKKNVVALHLHQWLRWHSIGITLCPTTWAVHTLQEQGHASSSRRHTNQLRRYNGWHVSQWLELHVIWQDGWVIMWECEIEENYIFDRISLWHWTKLHVQQDNYKNYTSGAVRWSLHDTRTQDRKTSVRYTNELRREQWLHTTLSSALTHNQTRNIQKYIFTILKTKHLTSDIQCSRQ